MAHVHYFHLLQRSAETLRLDPNLQVSHPTAHPLVVGLFAYPRRPKVTARLVPAVSPLDIVSKRDTLWVHRNIIGTAQRPNERHCARCIAGSKPEGRPQIGSPLGRRAHHIEPHNQIPTHNA